MTIKTASDYKIEFTKLANDIVVAYNQYKSGKRALHRLGSETPAYYTTLSEAILKSFRSYLRDICKEVSKYYQGDTLETFSYEYLVFDGLNLPKSIIGHDVKSDDAFIVRSILSAFDFTTLVIELKREAFALESKGKKNIANDLINQFKLGKNSWCSYAPKRTSRHISVDGSHYKSYGGYYHSDVERFNNLKCNVFSVANEFEEPPLALAFTELCDAVSEQVNDRGVLSSGTTFGNKNTVQIKVFNDHIRYSFTPQMMDLIFTYIKLYAPDEVLCEIPQAA